MAYRSRRACLGEDRPDGQFAECSDQVDVLEDCCKKVQIEDEILLWEHVSSKKGGYYYWFSLIADETPLAVCALEKYVDRKCRKEGRRADYLCVGWDLHSSVCYVLIIELRVTLLKTGHVKDKIEQVEQSIELVESDILPQIKASDFFEYACDHPEHYEIVGVIVPATRSMKRAEQKRRVIVKNKEYSVIALSNSLIKQCKINWSDLLRAIRPSIAQKKS